MTSPVLHNDVGELIAESARDFPPTRYQGSKRKLCAWIVSHLAAYDFSSALDAFGGTGCVAYVLKRLDKRVTYNDVLAANAEMAIALIENDGVTLPDATIDRLISPRQGACYPDFIQQTFADVYFTDEENAWLDRVCTNIRRMRNRHRRALAWYALFQSAIVKRPYNLFHRRNLYMRFADVERGFGNKRTWDKPFEEHFRAFAARANKAVVASATPCHVRCGCVLDVPGKFDMVYIDPPYVSGRGVGVDYAHFYHFLEGMLDYDGWPERIDWSSRHRRMKASPSPWVDRRMVGEAFARVFDRYRDSILAVSYRSDGVPTIGELADLLRAHKRRVEVHEYARYQYALSTNRRSREVLLIAR